MPPQDAKLARPSFQVPATATTPRLGECLRAARAARGLTLKQVSLRSGLAMSTLSKVENGQMSLTYDKLLQISRGLQIGIAELFEPPSPGQERLVTARRSISRAGHGQRVETPMYDYLYQFTDMKRKLMVPIMARLIARS